jgi:protein-disulfide isomerase
MKRIALGALLWVPLVLQAATGKSEIGLGKNSAPIIMEVYSDFQCSHCKLYHDQILPGLIHDYVDTGKVYLIHRDYVLGTFPHSKVALTYAIAASRVNKYEQVADTLFMRQEYWGGNGKIDEVVAGAVTPDEMKKIRVLINDPQVKQDVENFIDIGHKNHITTTPTVILTRHLRTYPVPPNTTYPLLRRFLDDLLSK